MYYNSQYKYKLEEFPYNIGMESSFCLNILHIIKKSYLKQKGMQT